MVDPREKTVSDVAMVYGITMVGVLLVWYTPLSYPIRLFATLTHELGHMVATLVTGGTFHTIQVAANTSGMVHKEGGVDWLISPAGYLSTVICGALMLIGCARSKSQRFALMATCLALVGYAGVAATSARVVIALGALLAWILVLLIMNWELLRGGTIRVLAVSLSIHSILDIVALLTGFTSRRSIPVWSSPVPKPEPDGFYTDATLMAWRYGGSEGLWASIWLGIGIVVMLGAISAAVYSELADARDGLPIRLPDRLQTFRKGEGEYTIS